MVYLRDVDFFSADFSAQSHRHVSVNFYYDFLCSAAHVSHVGSTRSEVEVTVVIHWSNSEHCYIYRIRQISVVSWQFGVSDWCIISDTFCDGLSFDTCHMPGVPAQVFRCVFDFEDFRFSQNNAATEFQSSDVVSNDVICNCLVQVMRQAYTPSEVNPVIFFNQFRSSFCADQFFCIFFLKAHLFILFSLNQISIFQHS